MLAVEINNNTATVSGSKNCHYILQNVQTSCLGLSFETIDNGLWHLEGVKTILTPEFKYPCQSISFLCN